MFKALPEYSLANGGLEKTKMGSREKELGWGWGGSSKEGRLGLEEEVSL